MGKLVVSGRFRLEISSIGKRKLPQIDPEYVEHFEVFVVFDTIFVQFLRDSVLSSNTINSTTKKRAMHYNF